jgi:enoyl-CoA hydratase/carnithine racemase
MNKGDAVVFTIDGSVGIITLNRPPENYLEIPEFIPVPLFREWMAHDDLKGLIIRGSGKNFSAGGNLERIFSEACDPSALQKLMEGGHDLLRQIIDLEIPVMAAIDRVCFGGGLEIALACHFRIASENALLAFPEVNRNLMPGMGGTFRLPAAIGRFQSAQMILGGDMINAQNAKSLGLIDHISPKDQSFAFAWSLMQKMTHDRPVKVIRYIMKTLKNAEKLSPEDAILEETRMFCDLARDEAERRKNGHGE